MVFITLTNRFKLFILFYLSGGAHSSSLIHCTYLGTVACRINPELSPSGAGVQLSYNIPDNKLQTKKVKLSGNCNLAALSCIIRSVANMATHIFSPPTFFFLGY